VERVQISRIARCVNVVVRLSVFAALREYVLPLLASAGVQKKLPDPDNPLKTAGQLTPDDVTKVVEAAKVIREAAQARQLTSA